MVITFAVYAYYDSSITFNYTSVLFIYASIEAMQDPFWFTISALRDLFSGLSSLHRLQCFLSRKDRDGPVLTSNNFTIDEKHQPAEHNIDLVRADIGCAAKQLCILHDLTITCPGNQLTLVIGPTASGGSANASPGSLADMMQAKALSVKPFSVKQT